MNRVVAAVFLLLLPLSIAFAQRTERVTEGFAVSPASISLTARPAAQVTGKFKIYATKMQTRAKFLIKLLDLYQTEEGAVSHVEVGKGGRSCAPWIRIAEEITIPAGGTKEVAFTISFPGTAKGGYYAFIHVEHIPERATGMIGVTLHPSIAIMLEAEIPTREPPRLDVKNCRIEGWGGVPAVVFTAANVGLTRTSVGGDVLLFAGKGTFPLRAPLPVHRTGRLMDIYPGEQVTFHCMLPRMPPPGSYKGVARLVLKGRIQSRSNFEVEISKSLYGRSYGGKIVTQSMYDLDLWIEPDVIEITVPPGGTRNVAIKIRNQDERSAVLHAQVYEVQLESDGLLTFPEAATPSSDWVTVSPESLTVDPRRLATVMARIKVPRDRPDMGSLIRAVRITATTIGEEEESGYEFGTLIIATDPKAPQPKLELAPLILISKSAETNPTAAVLNVKNPGVRVARVTGRITLERRDGQEIAYLTIGRLRPEIILPGDDRKFRMPIPPVDKGRFRVRAELEIPGQKGSRVQSEAVFTSTIELPTGIR